MYMYKLKKKAVEFNIWTQLGIKSTVGLILTQARQLLRQSITIFYKSIHIIKSKFSSGDAVPIREKCRSN